MFQVIHAIDYQDMCRRAANIISAQIILKPNCVLGLATGSTPVGIYRQLIDWYMKGDLNFEQVRTVNLDEYQNLSHDHPQSYHMYMQKHLFQHVNIDANNRFLPNGMAQDPLAECKRYDSVIADLAGIDLQLLGIGENGHIGFNEPGAAFERETHLVALSESTIQANARFFGSPKDVPTHAYTVGIKSIMQARRIVVAVNGEKKAEALYGALYGPITPALPASTLQLHSHVTIVADTAALAYCKQVKNDYSKC